MALYITGIYDIDDDSVLATYDLVWDITLFNRNNLNIKTIDYPAAGSVYIKKHIKTNLVLFSYTN